MREPFRGDQRQHAVLRRLAGASTLLLALGGCASAPPVTEVPADMADPMQLNEAAAASAARGDIRTAWLLLERAARLAPHDERIVANLAAVRDFRRASPQGRVLGAPTPNSPAPKPSAAAATDSAPPPAIWAAK